MFREDLIVDLVEGKHVLDCGGVDHSFLEEKQASGEWLHAMIADHAQDCLGVDILEERVEQINRTGRYKFLVANVEQLDFVSEFDVVVAGEIIEHVYNAGLFLDSAWRALKDNGLLILTTPNCHALSLILYSTIAGREVCHQEHTSYYSKQTLCYLVERHGFIVENCQLVNRRPRLRPTQWVRSAIQWLRPNLGEQVVVVARKRSAQDKYADKW